MRILHTFLLLVALVAPGLGQTLIDVLPNEGATIVGEICFLDLDYPGTIDLVCIKAPDNVTTDFDITLPAAPPAGTECMQMSNTGVISTSGGACGGSGDTHPIIDTTPIVEGSVDATKEFRLEVDALVPTTTTVVATVPSASFTFAGLEITQTFTQINTFSSAINLNGTIQAGDGTIAFGDDIILDADGAHDIGVKAGNRVRWGFADIWNADAIEVSNTAHTSQWSIQNNSTDLEFYDEDAQLVMEVSETASSIVLNVGLSGTSSGSLTLWSVGGSVRSATVKADTDDDGVTAGFEFNQDIWPGADGTLAIGFAGRIFGDAWIEELHSGNPGVSGTRRQGVIRFANTDVTNTNTATLAGIYKDANATVQIDNLHASTNLWIPSVAGDTTCTTLDDVYLRFNTTDEELQACSGGTTRLIPSTTTSFTPVTVNCAAGEVILDPRYEDGILVEGSCGAN